MFSRLQRDAAGVAKYTVGLFRSSDVSRPDVSYDSEPTDRQFSTFHISDWTFPLFLRCLLQTIIVYSLLPLFSYVEKNRADKSSTKNYFPVSYKYAKVRRIISINQSHLFRAYEFALCIRWMISMIGAS